MSRVRCGLCDWEYSRDASTIDGRDYPAMTPEEGERRWNVHWREKHATKDLHTKTRRSASQ